MRRQGKRTITDWLVVGYVGVVVLTLGVMLFFVGRSLGTIAWNEHPAMVQAFLGSLVLVALLALAGRRPAPEPELPPRRRDDDGGGGWGRREPPQPPEPRCPGGPCVDWDDFDALREGWEREPALV